MTSAEIGEILGRNFISLIVLGIGFYYGYIQVKKFLKKKEEKKLSS
jgi:hypothetical protein